MPALPLIFISATSRELKSARQLVANTLTFLGYQPIWQDIFGTEQGDLRGVLRQQINQCKGVVQLVGQCYGAEPPTVEEKLGRVSYTQYEALYARQRGKKVWYLFIDENFPIDECGDEPAELRALQETYRKKLQSDTHLYHPLTSLAALEATVLKLRNDLVRLRRGVKQWAAAVAILLVISVGLGLGLLHSQRKTVERLGASERQMAQNNRTVVDLKAEVIKLHQAIMDYPRIEAQMRQSQAEEDPALLQQRVYAALGKRVRLDPKLLTTKLPQAAADLQHARDATKFQRANAAYVAKNYEVAERWALAAAEDAAQARPRQPNDVVPALELAGFAAQKRLDFARAMEHFHAALALTERQTAPQAWAEVELAIGNLFIEQGHYSEATAVFRSVADLRRETLGPENPDTLRSRNRVAYAEYREGKYNEAIAEFRQILTLESNVFQPNDPEMLFTRNGLAIALMNGGKAAEAETELRQVLESRRAVLGPENPDTLRTRNNLALTLSREGKDADAIAEYEQLLVVESKVLGPENPDTLKSRSNQADALYHAGRFSEAETQLRDIIGLQTRILGPRHPDTLLSRLRLDTTLMRENKFADAQADFPELIQLEGEVLGGRHPDTLASRSGLANALQAQGKLREAKAQYRDIIALEVSVLGAEHPNTLLNRNSLANTLMAEGNYAEAESNFRELIQLERESAGPEDSLTLRSLRGLANALFNQKKYAAAEPEYRALVQIKEKLLGPQHREAIEANYDLAGDLENQGEIAEAKEFARRAAAAARAAQLPTQKYDTLVAELAQKSSP